MKVHQTEGREKESSLSQYISRMFTYIHTWLFSNHHVRLEVVCKDRSSDPDLIPDCLFSSQSHDLTFTPHPFALCLCQVEQQSPYVQGFKVLYRPSANDGQPEGQWSVRDVRAVREEGVVIGQLKRACVYEFKVRPFFDEFQGTDSEMKVARTLEEGKSASKDEFPLCTSPDVCSELKSFAV